MKKRKLKPAISRRPKNKASIDSIVDEVSKETGFARRDIKEVYQTLGKVIVRRMWKGQSVILPSLGTIMPFIKPRCIRHALYGGKKESELIEVPPKWVIRFVPMVSLKEKFFTKKVTKAQEDFIYKD